MIPPFKIKSVEPIRLLPKSERIKRIKRAGYNIFKLRASSIFIDLLTDSGTGAMSQEQWSAMMKGDESYAGSESFFRFEKAVKEVLGFPFVVPCHQGRGAERVFDRVMIKAGQAVPGNTHFDTTKAHIEYRKGKAVDCTISEAFDPETDHPFKGNVDLKKLEFSLKNDDVAYVLLTCTCNSIGGQPVSMANIKAVSRLARKYKKPLFMDGARFAENAFFIKKREKGYEKKSVKTIVKEMTSHFDGMLMSAKKDAIVNIGGFIAVRDKGLYEKLSQMAILFEGFPTYGGLSGRDMEAIAQGLYEGIDEDYLEYRTSQVKYLAEKLELFGIPVLKPVGGHAVYVNGKEFFDHIPQWQFPSQTLAVELYVEGGIRAVEIGTLLAGRDPETGENIYPELDLLRLTIPRRVYTKEHLDYVAECLKKVWERRESVKGLKLIHEPKVLRHFQARFERAEDVNFEKKLRKK
ncbi:tryptophanase [Candidatus Woesearchaeota archaeon]|nr:MAG: tryptophanase [Candidatus Woesearchaeota archaeon]